MDYNQAKDSVKQLKKFYKNLMWFGIISAIVFFKDIFDHGRFDFSAFNGSVILTIWGIILLVKAVNIFVFNSDWERKIVEQELRKDKKPINF